MRRLTYRSKEGQAQWMPELLKDDSGLAGVVIRGKLADYEDTGLEAEEVEQIKKAAAYMMFEDVAHFVRYTLSNFDELQKYKELGDYNRLRELAQADKEGRCVVLKCKPNATVWFIKSAFSIAHFPIEGNHVSIKGVACDGDIYCSAITAYNKISRSFYMSDIGKTVFLTREEAEAALRREQDG